MIFNGSMVLLFDLRLPPLDLHLRVSRHRLAPDDCLGSSVTGKAPCWPPVLSYPRLAPILTPPTFAKAASDNLFNLFVCNFWPERFNLFGVAFYYVQFRIMIC